MRIGFLKLATLAAVAAAVLAPAPAQAQTQAPAKNRGQLVKAVMQLNNAQLAFAKKLAEDAQFAAQFDQATGSGNYDAAASLAASATGLTKASIAVSVGALGGDEDHNGTSEASTQSVYQLASFSRRNERKMATSGKICFDVVIAHGCIAW